VFVGIPLVKAATSLMTITFANVRRSGFQLNAESEI
jgi:hypothetical protein